MAKLVAELVSSLSSVLFPEFMLSFLKGSVVGEGENQDELANFEGCFPQQVSGLYQRAQMVRMTDCSFAHAVMVLPRRGSCMSPAVFPSSRLALLGLSYFSH